MKKTNSFKKLCLLATFAMTSLGVTAQIKFGTNFQVTTKIVNTPSIFTDGTRFMHFAPGNTSTGAWNGLVGANDNAFIFSGGTVGTGNLVIAPWASSYAGLKIMGSTGYVGVGTPNPLGNFAVAANNGDQLITYSPADDALALQTTLNGYPIGTYGNLNRLALQPVTGLVGIGTITPAAKLDVKGLGSGTVDLKVNGRIQTGDAAGLGGIWLDNPGTAFLGGFGTAFGFWTSNAAGTTSSIPFLIQKGTGFMTMSKQTTIYDETSSFGLFIYRKPSNANGSLIIAGSANTSYFHFGVNEDTYIRGGKAGSKVYINDYAGSGPVNIGGEQPTTYNYKLYANGGIGTTGNIGATGEIWAGSAVHGTRFFTLVGQAWPDYVFEKEHKLKPLAEVEEFINTNKHLPNIPSAKELEKNGMELTDIATKQMEKIEELTLYMIQMNKEIQLLKQENAKLKKQ